MARRLLFLLVLITGALPCFAQKQPIDNYANNPDFNDANAGTPGSRNNGKLLAIMPVKKSASFADYVAAKAAQVDYATLLQDIDKLRLNKQVGSAAGASGITSLVSSVAAPAVIGLGVEYGSILQSTTGNTTTVRANLLGVSRMLLGAEQFPYCPVIAQAGCTPASRWARRFSGNTSFENVNDTTTTGTAVPASTATPTAVDFLGNGFRMASWGARFDITANDPSDPGYIARFQQTINTLRGSHTPADLATSVAALFGDPTIQPVYLAWQTETIAVLQAAPQSEFKQKLAQQLDALIEKLAAISPDFYTKVATLRAASQNYLSERDNLLQAIQSHKLSVEYTNLHSQNQPSTSNIRLIFSHQPSAAPLLLTANAALTWYNSLAAGTSTSRLRDVQLAGELDRRLGVIPNLGNAVMTLAGYYQWMKDDALITIGPGNVASGSGIVLPGTAATLLGTKGNIGVVQGRLTLPINNMVKIPLSVTWSNRKELINESETRAEVGITLDLDSIFK